MSAKVEKNGFMCILRTNKNSTSPGRVGTRGDKRKGNV